MKIDKVVRYVTLGWFTALAVALTMSYARAEQEPNDLTTNKNWQRVTTLGTFGGTVPYIETTQVHRTIPPVVGVKLAIDYIQPPKKHPKVGVAYLEMYINCKTQMYSTGDQTVYNKDGSLWYHKSVTVDESLSKRKPIQKNSLPEHIMKRECNRASI